jgi:hypothetical protein
MMFSNFFGGINKMFNAQPMELPYPEEPPDYTRTVTGFDLLHSFFDHYFVPEIYWNYWRQVTIIVDRKLPYPAGMVSETKTLLVKPEYTNPGILAHEFSHLSYSELKPEEKASYTTEYTNALKTDALLKYLYSQKQYMSTNIIEAHAEVFRYLGNKMPAQLKNYYPELLLPSPA